MRGIGLSAIVVIASLLVTPFAASRPAMAVGCDTPGAATTTIYLPNITKTLGGPTGWVTPFIVQNVGVSMATLELSFYEFTTGRLVTCRKITGLAPNTSFADVPNNDADLPHDSAFSVVVRAFGSDAVAVVNEHQGSGTRAESLSYVGLTSGSTRVRLPYVPKHVSGWLTTFVVQNLGPSIATVTASFVSSDGLKTATITRSVLPGRAGVVNPDVEASLIAGTEYAVTLTSTQPIGVVANAHNDAPTVTAPMAFSYNGAAPTPGATVYLPYVAKSVVARTSRVVVQNAGEAAATPTLRVTSRSGVQATFTPTAPVAPGRSWSPDFTSLAEGEHSATLDGGTFASLVITTDRASAFGYTGRAPAASRLYLPNVTHTLGGPLGWSTPLVIQSAGTTTATLRWFRFADGQLVHTQTLTGLTPGAGIRVEPTSVRALSADTQYAVVLDAPAPVTALVLEFSGSGGDSAMAYEGFASAAAATPIPFSVTLTPATVTLQRGQTAVFSAAVRDQFEAVIAAPPLTWSVTPATLGTVDASGLFTAGQAGGTGTVRATSGAASAIATVTVQVPTTATVGGITFRVTATATADVYAESTITTAEAQTILAVVDPSVTYIEAEFGRKFTTRPAIYAFRDTASMSSGWSSVLGATTTPRVVNGVFVPVTKRVGLNWGGMKGQLPYSTVRHELVHMMEHQITKQDLTMPLWFIEGIARLNDLSEPGGQWRTMQGRHQVASMAATGTLSATRMSDTEFRALSNAAASAAYFEGAETVRLMRSDMTPAGLNRFLEDIGGGRTFRDAFVAATGRSLETFLAGRDQRLRALAPAYPGIATANDTVQGAGLTYMFYGFSPGTSVTSTINIPGFLPSVRTVQVDSYGTFISYLDSAWPPGSYTITAVGGGQTATTTTVKVASTDELSIRLASEIGELPSDTNAVPTTLPE